MSEPTLTKSNLEVHEVNIDSRFVGLIISRPSLEPELEVFIPISLDEVYSFDSLDRAIDKLLEDETKMDFNL